jgi:hypothetical protein
MAHAASGTHLTDRVAVTGTVLDPLQRRGSWLVGECKRAEH